MSDEDGDLIFYTNGVLVFDKVKPESSFSQTSDGVPLYSGGMFLLGFNGPQGKYLDHSVVHYFKVKDRSCYGGGKMEQFTMKLHFFVASISGLEVDKEELSSQEIRVFNFDAYLGQIILVNVIEITT